MVEKTSVTAERKTSVRVEKNLISTVDTGICRHSDSCSRIAICWHIAVLFTHTDFVSGHFRTK